jgi:hypothetical protein
MSVALSESLPRYETTGPFNLAPRDTFVFEEAFAVGDHAGYRIADVAEDVIAVFGGSYRPTPSRRITLHHLSTAWDDALIEEFGDRRRLQIGHLLSLFEGSRKLGIFRGNYLALLLRSSVYNGDFLVKAHALSVGYSIDLAPYPSHGLNDPNAYLAVAT